MKKKLLLLTAIIFQSLFAAAQRFEWVSHSNQPAASGIIPVAIDPAGNVYTLIHTDASGTVIGTDTFPVLVPGNEGVLIAKFSASGNFIWGKMVGTNGGIMEGEKVAADNAGSVYASCYFGNSGQVHMTDTVFQPAFQGVIIKLDSSGHFVRAKVLQSNCTPRISCLGTDLYVGYSNTITKLDSALTTIWSITDATSALTFDQGCCSHTDVFVQTNGELIANAFEGFNGIGAIPFGNDTVHFNATNFNEVAVIKMDTSGQVLWTKVLTFGGTQSGIRAVALDHNGNAFLGTAAMPAGQFIFASDTLDNANGYCGILKWNAAGVPQWAKALYFVSGNGPSLYDFDINAQNELLVSGSGGVISVNGDTTLAGLHQNSYLLKFDSAGTFLWDKAESTQVGFSSYADGVVVRNGNEYIQGGSTGNIGTYIFGCLSFFTTTHINFVSLISENPEAYPVASFTFSVSNDTTYNFTDASTNATSWHWDFGDGDTSNIQNPSHDFTSGGSFTVILTVHNGPCSSVDTLQIIGVGIDEINATPSTLHLSPNPATNELTIQNAELKIDRIEIYNVLGEKVYFYQPETRNQQHVTISVADIPSGIYFVKVKEEKGESTAKFVKQ